MNWTTIELASAIVCACLPTYGPTFNVKSALLITIKSWYSNLVASVRLNKSSQSRAWSRHNDKAGPTVNLSRRYNQYAIRTI